MNSTYQSNIQPLQGCDNQFIVDRGLKPTVIQIAPLRGTINIEIKRISSNVRNRIRNLIVSIIYMFKCLKSILPMYQGQMPFCTILLPFLQDCTSDGYLV